MPETPGCTRTYPLLPYTPLCRSRYLVAAGDSLSGIARRFGLPIRAVIDAINLQPPYALSIGQELAVPRAQWHEVAPGDTVYNIARRYDVDRSEPVRLTCMQPPFKQGREAWRGR